MTILLGSTGVAGVEDTGWVGVGGEGREEEVDIGLSSSNGGTCACRKKIKPSGFSSWVPQVSNAW